MIEIIISVNDENDGRPLSATMAAIVYVDVKKKSCQGKVRLK